MFDLQALAFAADITRVFAFKLSRDVSNRVFREAASPPAFHIASHHNEREDRITDFAKINTYHVGLIPYFLEKLKTAARRGRQRARQLADRLRLADGQSERAQPQALPAVLRRARGRPLKGNIHIKAPDGTPMANAMLAGLQGVGARHRRLRRQHGRARPERGDDMKDRVLGVLEVLRC